MSYASGAVSTSAWAVVGQKRHVESFYAELQQHRDEALVRGENPYANYKRQLQEKPQVPYTERMWNRLTGKTSKKIGCVVNGRDATRIVVRNKDYDLDPWY
ncbi:hypothetical protein AB5N19_14311 [Seiridium cardinale]